MISNLEAKATILFANRAKRVLDALRADPKPEPKPPPKPKDTPAQRREKEKYGPHPQWRRDSGITFSQEKNLTPKQRRKGIKRLVKRLKEKWNASPRSHGDAENGAAVQSAIGNWQSAMEDDAVCHGQQSGCPCAARGDADAVCHGQQSGCPCARGEDAADTDTLRFSLTAPWERDVAAWTLPCNAGRSIEDLCVELQMSRARLTTLTKEYCGLTAQELIDGFRIGKLKNALAERLRSAARELCGPPGTFAWTKLESVPLPEGWPGPEGRVADRPQEASLEPQQQKTDVAGPAASCSLRSPTPRCAWGGPPGSVAPVIPVGHGSPAPVANLC